MKQRRFTIGLITCAFVIALTEAVSYAGLAVADRVLADPPIRVHRILHEQSDRIRNFLGTSSHPEMLDPVLGWRYRPGFAMGSDRVNSQDLRGSREYEAQPAAGVIRVAAFGDSFVYGSEVGPSAAWTRRIEVDNPDIEVLNYGVPGYGVDQALLRFRLEGRLLSPRYIILGFAPDDLRRLVNVYRPFISLRERPLAKPRFILATDTLALLPTPLPDTAAYDRILIEPRTIEEFGRHDQWYQPEVYQNPLYDWSATVRLGSTVWRQIFNRFLDKDRLLKGDVFNSSSEAFGLQLVIFNRFLSEARSANTQPLLVVFPDRESLTRMAHGKPAIYAPLTEALRHRRIEFIDLADAFPQPLDAGRLSTWFAPKGHYSAEGNRLVAAALAAAIRARESQRKAQLAAPAAHD